MTKDVLEDMRRLAETGVYNEMGDVLKGAIDLRLNFVRIALKVSFTSSWMELLKLLLKVFKNVYFPAS